MTGGCYTGLRAMNKQASCVTGPRRVCNVKAGCMWFSCLTFLCNALRLKHRAMLVTHPHTHTPHIYTFSLHHNQLHRDVLNLPPVQAIGTSLATRDRSGAVVRLQTFLMSGPHRYRQSLVTSLNTDVFLKELMNSIHRLHEVKAIPSRRDEVCIWKCTGELQ